MGSLHRHCALFYAFGKPGHCPAFDAITEYAARKRARALRQRQGVVAVSYTGLCTCSTAHVPPAAWWAAVAA